MKLMLVVLIVLGCITIDAKNWVSTDDCDSLCSSNNRMTSTERRECIEKCEKTNKEIKEFNKQCDECFEKTCKDKSSEKCAKCSKECKFNPGSSTDSNTDSGSGSARVFIGTVIFLLPILVALSLF